MDKWFEMLNEARAKRPGYRKKISRYTKDRDKILNVGGQKNTPPYTKKMGSHVTFDRQLGEEVEPATFEKQPSLDPKLWQDGKLNKNISKRLMRIAREFLDGFDKPIHHEAGDGSMAALMEDLRFTGSLANYNWSKYSDIDLHIVVDFSKIDENVELVKGFFDEARMRWNDLHDITIYGYEVEIYVENLGEVHKSTGIYSIADNDWLVVPNPEQIEFDYVTARKKADAIETQVNMIEKFIDKKPRAALKSIERLKNKIRKVRRAGLNSPLQEYSTENIAFKILRREETLDKLNNMKYDAYDAILSIG
jgi:predicted nucleotidyltransferase